MEALFGPVGLADDVGYRGIVKSRFAEGVKNSEGRRRIFRVEI